MIKFKIIDRNEDTTVIEKTGVGISVLSHDYKIPSKIPKKSIFLMNDSFIKSDGFFIFILFFDLL